MGWISVLNQEGPGSVLVLPIAYGLPVGKWYWEVKIANAAGADSMMANTARFGVYSHGESIDSDLGVGEYSWAFSLTGTKLTKNEATPCGPSAWNDDDVVMIAVDTAMGNLWFGGNGKWFGENGNWIGAIRNWFAEGKDGLGSPAFTDVSSEVIPAVTSTHGGTGTLHLFVPSDEHDYSFTPPEGFTALEPGARELLPKPTIIRPMAPPSAISNIAGEPSADRLEKRKIYQELASAYVNKRNWFMAEKLMVQIEACDPSDQSVHENMIWLQSLKETHPVLLSSRESLDERLFDFAYIPTEKCGSGAHGVLLAIHPDSTIPTSPQTQVAFQENAELALLKQFRQVVIPSNPNLKIGLVMDARISGARQQPSGVVTGDEYAQRLSKIVRPDGFLQAIRHPFFIARSTYNSHVAQYLYGNYNFAFANPRSPFSGEYVDIQSQDIRSRCGEIASHDCPTIDPIRLMERFEFAIRTSRPYSVGKAYSQYFEQWRILDLDRATKKRGKKRMGETYSAIGIQEDFSHPLDQLPYRDLIHFAMQRNHVRVEIAGTTLSLYIGRAGQTICSNDVDLIELFWLNPDSSLEQAGLNYPLCLAIPKNEWMPLSRTTKQRIVYSRELEEFFRDVLVPCWMAEFQVWRGGISRYLIGPIDEKLGKQMLEGVQEEAEAFLKIHSSVEESWSDLVAML